VLTREPQRLVPSAAIQTGISWPSAQFSFSGRAAGTAINGTRSPAPRRKEVSKL
jgi:hypothetical protein